MRSFLARASRILCDAIDTAVALVLSCNALAVRPVFARHPYFIRGGVVCGGNGA